MEWSREGREREKRLCRKDPPTGAVRVTRGTQPAARRDEDGGRSPQPLFPQLSSRCRPLTKPNLLVRGVWGVSSALSQGHQASGAGRVGLKGEMETAQQKEEDGVIVLRNLWFCLSHYCICSSLDDGICLVFLPCRNSSNIKVGGGHSFPTVHFLKHF